MNLSKPLRSAARSFHALLRRCQTYLPRQRCFVFDRECVPAGIDSIYVINLDRQPKRFADMNRAIDRISDARGASILDRVIRYSACDSQHILPASTDIVPYYTLADQLFVEPQPRATPDAFELDRIITMSQAEIAIAHSHIGVWRAIANGQASYALVLEDDVWFDRNFGKTLDEAWLELTEANDTPPAFDILYVSYEEVRHGAPKDLVSKNIFRPVRGLWFLSGYVLSKKGAQRLLDLLPCRGPVDLWVNHKFSELEVKALRRSIVNQRRDLHSTNSYSILPALSRIGIIDTGDAALFHKRPTQSPVFAFGEENSGLSSIAMALSMLGYRCCSDLDSIPNCELDKLRAGRGDLVFDAYVNVGALDAILPMLMRYYPKAKYIVIYDPARPQSQRIQRISAMLRVADSVYLRHGEAKGWRELCEHLLLAPPDAPYPTIADVGQRRRLQKQADQSLNTARPQRHDPSPWVVKSNSRWSGIHVMPCQVHDASISSDKSYVDHFNSIRSDRWHLRNDTFPGNLALFRPANVTPAQAGGLFLTVREEVLGVRNLSAAAISSVETFLFGRFEAILQATNSPGLVTGFFLHRSSPRQEIDIEITGNRPDRLLLNVFYNPGSAGAKFDYGYRGTPVVVELGFDASKSLHRFTIEWEPHEIRWSVDGQIVHRRAIWDPTPIPHLPMELHLNTWPARSRELAARLALQRLPSSALVRSVAVEEGDIWSNGLARKKTAAT